MRFLIDIDGTILTQQKPGEYEKCEPLPGALESINKLFDAGHQIVLYTSRNFKFVRQTHHQLRRFGFKYHHLEFGKPHADVIVDDRAIRFTSWPELDRAINAMIALGSEAVSRVQYDEGPSRPVGLTGEMARLAQLSENHSYLADFNEVLSRYRMRKLDELGCAGETALELGCGEGLITRHVATLFRKVEAVDGSSAYIERAKALVPGNVSFHHGLVEDFETSTSFDWIIAGGLLEHLADPKSVLKKAKNLLAPHGRIVVFVPNAVSLNRRLGKAMGLIEDCHGLTESDLKIGHRRMYDLPALRSELEAAGFTIVDAGGMFLKPLSNAQMMTWDAEILDGLYALGNGLPELCTEIYAVARVEV